MPTSNRDLRHKDRIIDLNRYFKNKSGIDSISIEHLQTTAKRRSSIYRLSKNGEFIPTIYVDFVSTTTSFFKIAEYKMKHPEYSIYNIDEIINEYTNAFITKTNQELEGDSIYIEFVTDKEKFAKQIKTIIEDKNK